MFNVLLLAPSDPPNTSITRHRLRSGSCTRSHWMSTTGTPNTVLAEALRTSFNGCSTRQPEWSVEPGSSIAACPNCFIPSCIGWTFHNVSSINSESQFTSPSTDSADLKPSVLRARSRSECGCEFHSIGPPIQIDDYYYYYYYYLRPPFGAPPPGSL